MSLEHEAGQPTATNFGRAFGMTMSSLILDLLCRMDDEKYEAKLSDTDVAAAKTMCIAAVDMAGIAAVPHTTPLVALCDQWVRTFRSN